ncbi:hypothetical protein HAX54_010939, partial [Datura stramonium]|nr:hypothetical protein [Datura stramonium]
LSGLLPPLPLDQDAAKQHQRRTPSAATFLHFSPHSRDHHIATSRRTTPHLILFPSAFFPILTTTTTAPAVTLSCCNIPHRRKPPSPLNSLAETTNTTTNTSRRHRKKSDLQLTRATRSLSLSPLFQQTSRCPPYISLRFFFPTNNHRRHTLFFSDHHCSVETQASSFLPLPFSFSFSHTGGRRQPP